MPFFIRIHYRLSRYSKRNHSNNQNNKDIDDIKKLKIAFLFICTEASLKFHFTRDPYVFSKKIFLEKHKGLL